MNHLKSDHEPFDYSRAMENLGEDEHLFKDLVDTFLAESAKQLRSLKEELRYGCADRVRHAAHTIKSSVGVFAADRALELAYAIEQMGAAGDLEAAPAAVADLEAEIASLGQSLVEHVKAQEGTCRQRQ